MAEETEFAMGAKASCVDGLCGEVTRMIFDPATETLTHLVIVPKHLRESGRLVPLNLVDTTVGEIRLQCTLAEFGRLEVAEETELLNVGTEGMGIGGMTAPMGVSSPVRTDVEEIVPPGETDIVHGERVHCVDGEIGKVEGFLVDPGDHRVTHVQLQEGHLWGRKEVAIPVSSVTKIENGIWLNLTKKQVEDLPAAEA
jgi:sporulation protein YlmC with PRC-barrel domain